MAVYCYSLLWLLNCGRCICIYTYMYKHCYIFHMSIARCTYKAMSRGILHQQHGTFAPPVPRSIAVGVYIYVYILTHACCCCWCYIWVQCCLYHKSSIFCFAYIYIHVSPNPPPPVISPCRRPSFLFGPMCARNVPRTSPCGHWSGSHSALSTEPPVSATTITSLATKPLHVISNNDVVRMCPSRSDLNIAI